MTKESSIKAVALKKKKKSSSSPFILQEAFQQFAAALQTRMGIGWLKPVIGPRYSLENAAQAHKDIIHSCGAMEKRIFSSND